VPRPEARVRSRPNRDGERLLRRGVDVLEEALNIPPGTSAATKGASNRRSHRSWVRTIYVAG
jgi:hypothetical protein